MDKLWKVLYAWNHHDGEFDNIWMGYSTLEDETGIPVKELKKITAVLRAAGIMFHSPAVNSDMSPSGSGNYLLARYENKTYDEMVEIFERAIAEASRYRQAGREER
jgi:hypothetical protein